MEQYAPVLDRPRTIRKDKIRKLPRLIQPPQQTIYVNSNGIDPPHDWLDDLLVALERPRGPYTVENAEAYLDTEPVELYNGWLVKEEMSDFVGKKFEGRLQAHMVGAASLLKFGEILPDQMECHLKDGFVIKPDLSLVSWERQRTQVKPIGPNNRPSLVGSPEFVVEVRSPSNTRTKDEAKRKRYFDNGAEIIWDVDEKKQIIYVYRADSQEKPQTYTKDHEIDCETLLPGWRRQVSDLFEEGVSVEVMFSEVVDTYREEGREEGEKIGEQRGREEGEKIGEQRGREEGEKTGESRGKQDTLIRLLQARFTSLPDRVLNTIEQTHDVAQLDAWFDQALMAPTLDKLNI